ncbi:MAG: 30S ribosomal protein S11 [Deltaproteobacteria bacterium]|nr:30S ribosomal protein S11 [Deltaproteobacteria bacterium]
MAKTEKESKKKFKKAISAGFVHILSSFNNTLVTFTDPAGNVICSSSAGGCGFKGTKKGTPFAAQVAGSKAAEKAKELGVKTVGIFLKGIGAGRETAIRAVAQSGIKIKFIRDVTPIPHNGCRPRKMRRV